MYVSCVTRQESSRAPSPEPEDEREADFKRRLEELERREAEIEQKEVGDYY